MTLSYDPLKRAMDVVASATALVLFSPVLVGVAFAVRRNLGSPAIFRHDRPGRGGQVFTLYKFRTMKHVDEDAGLVTDEQRLTAFGRRLRATSLDELPELWNVLKGDMSLVGPRPLTIGYLPLYNRRQARRHDVRPGLTGLAQVQGRNELDWPERLELDVLYVESRSLLVDLKILARTIAVVMTQRGINHEGHATMPRFEGNGSGA